MACLVLIRVSGGSSVQDLGRTGYLAQGLSRGGAADTLALYEAAALLDRAPDRAALELAGPATLRADGAMRVALTGAPMRATRRGEPLAWNATHRLEDGDELTLGAACGGVWSYVCPGGGIDTAPVMGSRSTHLSVGLGAPLRAGDALPVGRDAGTRVGRALRPIGRAADAPLRLLPSTHTHLFDQATLARFQDTTFTRSPRGNRQGVRLDHEGEGFATAGQLSLLSEIIVPGDVQMTGGGTPYLLGPECQSIGGYPRIGSVVPGDLPRALQMPPGAPLRFEMIDREAALDAHLSGAALLARLGERIEAAVRDPRDIPDLLGYQLVGGVTAGHPDAEGVE